MSEDPNNQIEDVTKETEHVIVSNYFGYLVLYILLFIGSLAVIFKYQADLRLIILPVMIGIFGYGHIYKIIKSQFMQQLAAEIGFTYSPAGAPDSFGGHLLSTGHSQHYSDFLSGIHEGYPMKIFTYTFTIGYGRNSHTYSYTVFEVTLNNEVPNILLFSKAHQNAITDFLSGDETVDLEGDFNKYFKLRVPKGKEQEAYQIFAPNVMADLIDYANDYSLEFVGNHLYLYATKVIGKREDFENMFKLVTYLDGLFRRNASGVGPVVTDAAVLNMADSSPVEAAVSNAVDSSTQIC